MGGSVAYKATSQSSTAGKAFTRSGSPSRASTPGAHYWKPRLYGIESGEPHTGGFRDIEILEPRRLPRRAGHFAVVQVIPTGIGCNIGGFAGDACPATNLLAAAADCVVTHPNAVNASELNEMSGNVYYVEGKLLDDFLLGHIAFEPTRGNQVGTLVDASATNMLRSSSIL